MSVCFLRHAIATQSSWSGSDSHFGISQNTVRDCLPGFYLVLLIFFHTCHTHFHLFLGIWFAAFQCDLTHGQESRLYSFSNSALLAIFLVDRIFEMVALSEIQALEDGGESINALKLRLMSQMGGRIRRRHHRASG